MKPALLLYHTLWYFVIVGSYSLDKVLRSYSVATMNTFNPFISINTLRRCIVGFVYLGVFWIFWMFPHVQYVVVESSSLYFDKLICLLVLLFMYRDEGYSYI